VAPLNGFAPAQKQGPWVTWADVRVRFSSAPLTN